MSNAREEHEHKHRHHHHKKHHYHHGHDRKPTTYPKADEAPVVVAPPKEDKEVKEKIRSRSTHTKSEAYADSNRFFHQNELRTEGAVQTTNVTVNIADKKEDDGMASCFSGIAKCFGKGVS